MAMRWNPRCDLLLAAAAITVAACARNQDSGSTAANSADSTASAASAGLLADTTGLSGHWQGLFAFSETETIHVRLELGRFESGWIGEADAVELGAENYPVEVEFQPPSLRLRFSGADCDFEGLLRSGNQQIAGAVRFDDEAYGLEFERKGEPQFSPTFLALMAAGDKHAITALAPDAAELRAQFESDSDKIRLIMLLAPT